MRGTIATMVGAALALAACSDDGTAGAGAATDALTADATAPDGGGGAGQDVALDAGSPFGAKDSGTLDGAGPGADGGADAAGDGAGDATSDTASDAGGAGADGAGPGDVGGADAAADAGEPNDAAGGDTTVACVPIDHTPVTQAERGPVPITASSTAPLVLHWRRSLPGDPWWTVPMAGGGAQAATIPGDTLTFAGVDYWLGASSESCEETHPDGAPGAFHHVDLIGEYRITSDPDVYDYLPDVDGHRVVFAKEKQGGQYDNVYLFDLFTFETTQITSLSKPQGDAHIAGDNVVWVDGRNIKNEWDPNPDIYLWDLGKGLEHPVVTAPLGQYGVTIAGRIVAWRDDRHMDATIDGDIYLYDMGPDGRMGTADDRGEHRLTPDPADQTAPAVTVDEDGRVRVVWADFRDDADGKCDMACDWNVYLADSGPDGVFGTEDDIGPIPLTSQKDEQQSPTTWGQRVAWLDAQGGNWMDPDIHVYDLGPDRLHGTADDGGELTLPVPTKEPDHLSMWGDRMVFEDFRNDTWDLWMWDFAKGTESSIVALPMGQFYPRLSGRTVVWQDARNNEPDGEPFDDIYVRVLPE